MSKRRKIPKLHPDDIIMERCAHPGWGKGQLTGKDWNNLVRVIRDLKMRIKRLEKHGRTGTN